MAVDGIKGLPPVITTGQPLGIDALAELLNKLSDPGARTTVWGGSATFPGPVGGGIPPHGEEFLCSVALPIPFTIALWVEVRMTPINTGKLAVGPKVRLRWGAGRSGALHQADLDVGWHIFVASSFTLETLAVNGPGAAAGQSIKYVASAGLGSGAPTIVGV